ncbi:MAG TPA: acetylglutamate kinase [Verrucomicrobiae bacterium]|jgi:acetylglutamate kinase|nr:acetylglutamate kinase [Verrucomicrobiae bacterium]
MQELVEKADILIEALPYIKKFRGKEFLVKYGGAALTYEGIRDNVLHDLVFMNYVGIRPILIHGGGIHITENLKKKGIKSQFVNGLRVTDKATIDTVIETLAEINKDIAHDLNKFGARAIGLSGHSADIIHVTKHTENGDVGYVGAVQYVNISPLKELTGVNIIPVIYPIGIDEGGHAYNVNADDAAAAIAAAMGVQRMVVLTNVNGILSNVEDKDSLISSLQCKDVQDLIDRKIISGGMIPKVKACMTALEGGVKKAHIIDGRIKHSLLLEIFTDKGIGTEITL